MLNKAVEISKLDKKMAIGSNLPQLAVGASAFSMDMMDKTSSNALIFATLSIPISDWWGGSHKIKEKQISINMAQNKLAETSELLNLQMQQTKQQAEESYWEVEYAKEAETEAGEHLKVVTDNYHAGVVSTSDLLEAKAMHQQALDNLTDANCHYQIAVAKFKQANGQY
jgi:outer membrane protein TolC